MNDKVFEYNGSEITFQLGNGDVMVNATQMAKPFRKTPKDFFRTEYIKDFCVTLCECKSLMINKWAEMPLNNATDFSKAFAELVICKQGNPKFGGGVFFHEDLALEFARWLSLKFGIWCNDRLKELLKYGFTATDQTLDKLIANPERGVELFTALKEERKKHAAELKNEQECSKLQWAMCVDQGKYIQELRESALIQKISERRYLFVAIEQQRLLKQNNIPIPTNLKIARRLYERDLKRLKI